MSQSENPDLYLCTLLTQMVTAREGDVGREFRAVVKLMMRLRDYEEEAVLELLQAALDLDQQHSFDEIVALCKQHLDDAQLREAIAMLAFLARVDGKVSPEEEAIFARLCLGLGVTVTDGKVDIRRD